ncbi:MAG: hypothetical protein IJC02_12055 [Lachnospiraceae bacterium]|nr:hypothetical protein [Lachnospiraceae bacterium]
MVQKRITKSYDQEFKLQAVKLAEEIGGHKSASELGIPSGTIYSCIKPSNKDVWQQKKLHIRPIMH